MLITMDWLDIIVVAVFLILGLLLLGVYIYEEKIKPCIKRIRRRIQRGDQQ